MRRANPVRRLIVFALLVAVASVTAIILMALPNTSQAAGRAELRPRIGSFIASAQSSLSGVHGSSAAAGTPPAGQGAAVTDCESTRTNSSS